jgi:hypothetical protein
MEDFIKDFHGLMHAPKWVQLLMFFGFSLFVMVALAVIVGGICSVRQDIYLRKHYFGRWKLRRGSPEDRRKFIMPNDPFLNKLTCQCAKIHHWIMITWFAVLIIMSLIIIFD